ncbi:hypothetical protein JTE90_014427 [Oedothorax gibbosus]|uniref:Uncharacterized protein n=1 Tax=Oedothorax gibbosus TaxID=931172 RepID=A0AAV6V3X9_9ARAC|nr:hypothetical protein JTE90_014427 [Oedothorax gibbosus]
MLIAPKTRPHRNASCTTRVQQGHLSSSRYKGVMESHSGASQHKKSQGPPCLQTQLTFGCEKHLQGVLSVVLYGFYFSLGNVLRDIEVE